MLHMRRIVCLFLPLLIEVVIPHLDLPTYTLLVEAQMLLAREQPVFDIYPLVNM